MAEETATEAAVETAALTVTGSTAASSRPLDGDSVSEEQPTKKARRGSFDDGPPGGVTHTVTRGVRAWARRRVRASRRGGSE